MYSRHLTEILLKSLRVAPALLLTGPRQSGKTTLMKILGEHHDYQYISFDNVPLQAAALRDPVGFIAELKKPVILDEVQRIPELFLPIKADIDQNRIPGRYLLTGSVNPLLVPKLGDALTGRMFMHQLWPLSQGEILGVKEAFLDRVFSNEYGMIGQVPCSRHDIIEKAIVGGFPEMQTLHAPEDRERWCDNYLSLALQKDIQNLARIEGIGQLPNLLCTLATRIGSLINTSDISNGTDIPITTLRRYLQLMHSLFLIYNLPAWHSNIRKRLTKASKIYFTDTAMLTYLLKMDLKRLLEAPVFMGSVIENFVVMELVKQTSWYPSKIEIFHCRMDSRIEVDIVLENREGQVVGIEVKSSETVRSDDFKNFRYLREAAGDKFLRGIVLYAGDHRLPFGKDHWAIPISELWQ